MAQAIGKYRWNYRHSLAYGLLAVLGLAFIISSYKVALKDHDGSFDYFLLHLSINLPEIAIWLLSMVGAMRLKNYAISIRSSRDGNALDDIANALLLLVVYTVLLSMMGFINNLFAHTGLIGTVVAFSNHLPLLIILLSAILLWRGSVKLLTLMNTKNSRAKYSSPFLAGIFIIYALFILAFTENFYHYMTSVNRDVDNPRFLLAPGVLMFTYVLPHLITWLYGLLAALNLAYYSRHVSGVIYKQLFRNLQRGVVLVFFCTFVAQILIASTVSDQNMGVILGLIYVVLLLGIVGFWLVYKGTKSLELLEK
jgi:hypothetical protein